APGCDDSECISVSCSACRQTIHPSHLLHHKKAHRALTLLDFDSPQARTDKKALLAQRQRVISKLSEMPQHSETQRQKIDYSFEFLTGDHAPTSHCSLDTTNNPRTLRVSTSFIRALSVCQDSNSTWQGHMQDRFTVLDNYGNRSETCLLGLAGGSHGVAAAETVAAELPLLLLDQLAQTDSSYRKSEDEQQILDSFGTVFGADYRERESLFADELGDGRSGTYERIHKAHAKAFWRMDRLLRLGRNEVSKVRWSGCSAVTCLVERSPSQQTSSTEEEDRKLSESSAHSLLDGTARGVAGLLHVANTGNAHVVLCRNGKSHCLSREHSTSNAAERRRILQSGGNISTNEPDGLVEGCLKTTRALGYHGDPALKRSVIPVPHVVSVPIDDTCQFLILASSGLWEVLDYREVVALTLAAFTRYLRAYESVRPDSASPCKRHSLVPLAEDNLKDSNVTDDLQDETEILYSSQGTQVSDSKGNLTQNQPGGSRRSYLQSGAASPAGYQPPPHLEEDTTTYPCNCKPNPAGAGQVPSATLYDSAASYISKQLVMTALAAGSRESITVLIALLSGC
ncbi:PP2D1 protein, partial [Rhinopomastus cyanomelas]|nr:PP2D1 protein [Rhinopomastus cyanomelas]